jgi:hypothetical protein
MDQGIGISAEDGSLLLALKTAYSDRYTIRVTPGTERPWSALRLDDPAKRLEAATGRQLRDCLWRDYNSWQSESRRMTS